MVGSRDLDLPGALPLPEPILAPIYRDHIIPGPFEIHGLRSNCSMKKCIGVVNKLSVKTLTLNVLNELTFSGYLYTVGIFQNIVRMMSLTPNDTCNRCIIHRLSTFQYSVFFLKFIQM